MAIEPPFWFKQRQGKMEEAGPDTIRVTGPNMREAVIGIRPAGNGQWQAFLRTQVDGGEVALSGEHPRPYEAWQAAFELYRNHVIF